ncbi:MAG: glycosyltransferase family 39 protein [Actinobacteria bacterium]|nr:glycosyltransferase family 39 protein [Actinomycetota bacterium]
MKTITRPVAAPLREPGSVEPRSEHWARALPLLAPDLAGLVILVLAARQLAGAPLVRMVLFGGALLAVRRAAFVAWTGTDPLVPSRSANRHRAVVMAVGFGLVVLAAGLPVALPAGQGLAVVVLALAFLPAMLTPLEHQVLRTCGRSGTAVPALAGAAVTLVVGAALLAKAPSAAFVPVVALAAGDPVSLALSRHRRHDGTCGLLPQQPSATPVEVRRRSPVMGAVASVLIGTMPLVALLTSLGPNSDKTLIGALVVLGLLPLLAAGIAPVLVVRNVAAGRRDALMPALLVSATAGSAVVLVALIAPGLLLHLSDARLGLHAAYFAVAMAGLGLAHVLVHQRVAEGAARTALVLTALAVALQVTLTLTGRGTAADVAVDAAVAATAMLLVGLAIATAVSAPVPLVLPVEEAGEGPRLVGWALLALTAVGAAVRLATPRDIWLDEALTARITDAPFLSMFHAAASADAHPPLQMVLSWASRQAFGPSPFALRLPSLVAGILLVPLLYVTGKELYDRRAGLAAAALGAFAPTLVWFSTQARPAALATLLAVMAVLTMLCALRCGRPTDWALFGLVGAALVWSHQLALVHLAVLHGAIVVALIHRRRAREPVLPSLGGWLLALTLVALATAPLLVMRSGLGPSRVLPPLEYATAAAPGGETSVFPLIGSLLSGVFGFHPVNVTSRLLALWPLGILGGLLVLGRTRSRQGPLLLLLATAPVAFILLAQLLGTPRRPTFALGWFATAVPALVLVIGRGLTMVGGRWPRMRLLTVGAVAVLVVALVDQTARVRPLRRFDVTPAVAQVASAARPGDLVVYEPKALGDVLRYKAPGVEVRSLDSQPDPTATPYRRVFVVAAFSLTNPDSSVPRVVDYVTGVSAERSLRSERGRDVKVWTFE